MMNRNILEAKHEQAVEKGQSLVEMAFILPLLLILLFGIIDLGYYVYCYGTVYQAARRGSDMAAYYPPFPTRLDGADVYEEDGTSFYDEDAYDMSDKCVYAVVKGTQEGAFLVDLSDIDKDRNQFSISYRPAPYLSPDPEDEDPRKPGKTIVVAITHTIDPLTPLFNLIPVFGNEGRMTVYATSMRTIQGRGEGYEGNRVMCQK